MSHSQTGCALTRLIQLLIRSHFIIHFPSRTLHAFHFWYKKGKMRLTSSQRNCDLSFWHCQYSSVGISLLAQVCLFDWRTLQPAEVYYVRLGFVVRLVWSLWSLSPCEGGCRDHPSWCLTICHSAGIWACRTGAARRRREVVSRGWDHFPCLKLFN